MAALSRRDAVFDFYAAFKGGRIDRMEFARWRSVVVRVIHRLGGSAADPVAWARARGDDYRRRGIPLLLTMLENDVVRTKEERWLAEWRRLNRQEAAAPREPSSGLAHISELGEFPFMIHEATKG